MFQEIVKRMMKELIALAPFLVLVLFFIASVGLRRLTHMSPCFYVKKKTDSVVPACGYQGQNS